MQQKSKYGIRLLVIYLTLITFVSANVGLTVYTHSCSISGVEKSLFVQQEDPCETEHNHHSEVIEQPSCCTVNHSENEQLKDGSCCDTDTDYVALQIDTRNEVSDLKITLATAELFIPTSFFSYFVSATQPELKPSFQQHYDAPPIFQGRAFQSIHQVYII